MREKQLESLLLDLLERVERTEEPLLAWGDPNVGLDESAVETLARTILAEHGLDIDPDLLLNEADRTGLLYFDDVVGQVRSRAAETLRLMASLRQLVHGTGEDSPPWQSRPTLVRDFRFERRPRRRPKRDRSAKEVHQAAQRALQPVSRDALQAMLQGPDGNELALSGFQERSVAAVLQSLASSRPGGVMISAGTGSGKTKAFYLPALAHLAGLVDSTRWTKLIAVYPRQELLKDQFSEAVKQARLLDPVLKTAGRRKLVLAAYYGDVPFTIDGKLQSNWKRRGNGHVCPYLRCPSCDGDLVRPLDNKRRLECTCGASMGSDEVQLHRRDMAENPPDIVFTTAEMLNRSLAHLSHCKIVGVNAVRPPQMVLLDEVHTYTGINGAQTALLLRRWAHRAGAHGTTYVGLSATLREPRNFFSQVTGVPIDRVESVEVREGELETAGAEYLLALRNDAGAGAATLSTSIQACMLLARCLDHPDRPVSGGTFGSKLFAFTDNLDVANRFYSSLSDAEGRTIWNRPVGSKPSLAVLRHPALEHDQAAQKQRHLFGQSWALPLQLGNDLTHGDFVRVGRVHSKDAGVDADARVIVATASLEIGYDDPGVGAVLQHGAPRDVAQFLQRQGRAGRSISMRPWTVIVLSEYGRDRLSYESWDLLFNPELPPKQLPIGNRYLLRMHAAAALLDWLSEQLAGKISSYADLWRLLAAPPDQGIYHESNRSDQLTVAAFLERLLDDEKLQSHFANYLAQALQIEATNVDEILWYPPRSILLSAVPALVRRLRTCWHGEVRMGGDDSSVPSPLPEHMSANLFSALELPEVEIHAERSRGRGTTFEEILPFDRAMREFCPGNVSRRAATYEQTAAHWVPVPNLDVDEIQDIDPHDHYGSLVPQASITVECSDIACNPSTCVENNHELSLFRPDSISLTITPQGLSASSRAFPIWHSSLEPHGSATRIDLPADAAAGPTGLTFYLNAERAHVRTVRAVIGTDGSALLNQQERRYRTRFRSGEEACAIGVTSEVDAAHVGLRIPADLAELNGLPDPLVRGLRAAWLRHRFELDLHPYANQFQSRWLHDAAVAAVALELELGEHPSINGALDVVEGQLAKRMQEALRVLFERVDTETIDGTPMRIRDAIVRLLASDALVSQIRRTLQQLRKPLEEAAEPWLLGRLQYTFGLAVLRGAQIICADQDPEAIILDHDANGDLWLTEVTPGGAGFLEELLRRVSADPRRFTRAVRHALAPSDSSAVDSALRAVLAATGTGNSLDRALQSFRVAHGPEQRYAAILDLRDQLDQIGHAPTHATVAALLARLLRPGSSPQTDTLVAGLVRSRDRLEQRLGIEVDNRTFAFLASDDPRYSTLTSVDGRTARLNAIQSVLWRRGWEAEADALSAWNPYEDSPPSAGPILRHRLTSSSSHIEAADTNALADCLDALAFTGSATLRCDHTNPSMLAVLISRLAARTVDLDVLRCRPRLSSITRVDDALLAVIELPEVA